MSELLRRFKEELATDPFLLPRLHYEDLHQQLCKAKTGPQLSRAVCRIVKEAPDFFSIPMDCGSFGHQILGRAAEKACGYDVLVKLAISTGLSVTPLKPVDYLAAAEMFGRFFFAAEDTGMERGLAVTASIIRGNLAPECHAGWDAALEPRRLPVQGPSHPVRNQSVAARQLLASAPT